MLLIFVSQLFKTQFEFVACFRFLFWRFSFAHNVFFRVVRPFRLNAYNGINSIKKIFLILTNERTFTKRKYTNSVDGTTYDLTPLIDISRTAQLSFGVARVGWLVAWLFRGIGLEFFSNFLFFWFSSVSRMTLFFLPISLTCC